MSSKKCSIGISLDLDCNKTIFSRAVGIKFAKDVSSEERKLIVWRSKISLEDNSSVCFHHEKIYLTRYESLQRYCCDPNRVHDVQKTSKELVFF